MPLLKLETTVALSEDKRQALLASLSKTVAETIGKPQQYVMVAASQAAMQMSGNPGDAAFVDVRSIGGLTDGVNRKLSQKVCQLLHDSRNPAQSYLPQLHRGPSEPLGLEREHFRVMAMDLPEAKGTYVLIAFVAQMKRLEIGRLGAYDIVPGYYAYVGSAFGEGGLRARIGHHLESTATPHWHIDYLLGVAEPVEVWYTRANQKLEHRWAELLEEEPRFRVPIRRFGSSDYHRSRSSHLFFSKGRPSFQWFRLKVEEHFEGVQAELHLPERPSQHR